MVTETDMRYSGCLDRSDVSSPLVDGREARGIQKIPFEMRKEVDKVGLVKNRG